MPVVHDVLNAISLLQKYTERYFVEEVAVDVEGELTVMEAEPLGVRYPILVPLGVQ